MRQTKCQKQTCVENCSQVPINNPNASFLSISCNSKQGLPRKHQGILWGSMGGSCHATANGDAAAAQKGAIAKVARQRKIAKVAQLVLNASVYGAGMTCMMIIQYWLVVSTPLKNISQLGLLFPIYGKIKHVPNHQPE